MKPKWCSCTSQDADACDTKFRSGDNPSCFCGCHKVERRPPMEVRAHLMELLGSRVKFVPTDISDDPHALVVFTLKDDKSEIVVEYQAGEGFGLSLTGWCEDEDRTYNVGALTSKITYWLDGYI